VSERLIGEWRRLGVADDFMARMMPAKGLPYEHVMRPAARELGEEA